MNKNGELYKAQRQLVIHYVYLYAGNRTHAAKVLGVSVRRLRDWLIEYKHDGWTFPKGRSNVWRKRK